MDLSSGKWDMKFVTWNVQSIYRSGSLIAVTRELLLLLLLLVLFVLAGT
jgi:hypothetical protein